MLDAMRKRASSWVVRVLLGLLIVSFAVWGIGDIFLGPRGGSVVAEVGELEISTLDVNREFEDQIAQLSAQLGTNLDRRQALAFGLLTQSVQSEIAERLVDMHGRELGIGVADSAIRTAIAENPYFRGESGFDRQRLELVLRSQGLSEDSFIEQVRGELRRELIIAAVSGMAQVPSALTEGLHAFRNETRRATMLRIEADRSPIGEPDDAALETYLEENKSAYEAPEYRSGVLVVLEPADLLDEIEIAEDELEQEYEARLDGYTTPERRRVGQLLASDKAVIEEAATAISEGATLAELADSMAERGLRYTPLGPVGEGDLPAGLSDAIFALPDSDAISPPVESAFGWHLFRLIETEPETVTPLDDVREALREELALDRARLQLPDLANALDDEIAAGGTLESAATQLGLELARLEGVDRSGRDRDGVPLELEGITGGVMNAFFSGEIGETSLLEETAEGYLMYRVDTVEEPRERTLDEVRDRLVDDWRREERQKASRATAESLLERVATGATLEALAEEQGEAATLVTSDPLLRTANGASAGLDQQAVAKLFELDAGSVADEVIEVPGGAALLRNDEIIDAEPAESLAGIEGQVRRDMRSDLLVQYEQALRARYPVQVHDAALQALAEALDPQT